MKYLGKLRRLEYELKNDYGFIFWKDTRTDELWLLTDSDDEYLYFSVDEEPVNEIPLRRDMVKMRKESFARYRRKGLLRGLKQDLIKEGDE